jgi:biotin/methionine sulfoxide reductase
MDGSGVTRGALHGSHWGAFYPLLRDGRVVGSVLTLDKGTSRLAQGPSAQTALVEIERFEGELPAMEAFEPPV